MGGCHTKAALGTTTAASDREVLPGMHFLDVTGP